ncbi:MAG: hypothetical protein IJ141_10675 [Lachnospiraceae bacterium]|nr:hypothetical protein [Lachnospiraceae bacterium]
MKINKWLIYMGLFVGAISIIIVITFLENEIVKNIGISLFAGAIVATNTSLLYYIYERNKFLSQIKNALPTLYVNIVVLKQLTGIIVPQVATSQQLSALNYRRLSSIADSNVTFVNNIGIEDFCGFWKKSKTEKAIKEFEKYLLELWNLKHCLEKVECYALEADALNYSLINKQIYGQMVSSEENKLLFNKRNTVNIQTAKVHEYEASMLIKLDSVAEPFYNKKKTWKSIKLALQSSVEKILKESM